MHTISQDAKRRLQRLAKLRSEGKYWPAIAQLTGWSVEECEQLTQRHRTYWLRLLRRWLRLRAVDAALEGLAVLRMALREVSGASRRAAAAVLPHYLRLTQGKPSGPKPEQDLDPELEALLNFCRNTTPEQRQRIHERALKQWKEEILREIAAETSAPAEPPAVPKLPAGG